MTINLSNETITTVYNSLKSNQQSLKRQLKTSPNKTEIIKHQLEEIENALHVFDELIEMM